MFVNKLFTYLNAHISKSERCFNVKSSTYYFLMKTNILADFQICISISLIFIQCLYVRYYKPKAKCENPVLV